MSGRRQIPGALLAVMVLFGLFAISLPAVFWFRAEYYEICPSCARNRDVQDWIVPFTDLVYYSYNQESETELSQALAEEELVDEHEHTWLMVRGFAPGNRIIYGPAFGIAQGMNPPSVGRFVRLLHRYTDDDTLAYWFARMTHSDHSYVVRNVADQCVDRSYESTEAFLEHLEEVQREQISNHHSRLNINFHEVESRTPPRLLYERAPR